MTKSYFLIRFLPAPLEEGLRRELEGPKHRISCGLCFCGEPPDQVGAVTAKAEPAPESFGPFFLVCSFIAAIEKSP
jgi:hypothetical protein